MATWLFNPCLLVVFAFATAILGGSAQRVLSKLFNLHYTHNVVVSELQFFLSTSIPTLLLRQFFLVRNILARTTLICCTLTDRAAHVILLLLQSLLNAMRGTASTPTAK